MELTLELFAPRDVLVLDGDEDAAAVLEPRNREREVARRAADLGRVFERERGLLAGMHGFQPRRNFARLIGGAKALRPAIEVARALEGIRIRPAILPGKTL